VKKKKGETLWWIGRGNEYLLLRNGGVKKGENELHYILEKKRWGGGGLWGNKKNQLLHLWKGKKEGEERLQTTTGRKREGGCALSRKIKKEGNLTPTCGASEQKKKEGGTPFERGFWKEKKSSCRKRPAGLVVKKKRG